MVPESVLKILYNSFVQSHLNYCSSVWGLGSKNSLEKLFVSQKRAVRAIENRHNKCSYDKKSGDLPCHTKEIFGRNKIFTIHNMIAKNCMITMHKVYQGIMPKPIKELFSIVNITAQNNKLRDLKLFNIPFKRLKSADNTILVQGPQMYNSIAKLYNKNRPVISKEPLLQNNFCK